MLFAVTLFQHKYVVKNWAKTSFLSPSSALLTLKNNLQTLQLKMEEDEISHQVMQEEFMLQTKIQTEL
jgi:hypothetical protein